MAVLDVEMSCCKSDQRRVTVTQITTLHNAGEQKIIKHLRTHKSLNLEIDGLHHEKTKYKESEAAVETLTS